MAKLSTWNFPKFSRNVFELASFVEQFRVAIHNKIELDDLTKFVYLRSLLEELLDCNASVGEIVGITYKPCWIKGRMKTGNCTTHDELQGYRLMCLRNRTCIWFHSTVSKRLQPERQAEFEELIQYEQRQVYEKEQS
ncbi:DNA-directed RNA polymerase subunit beta' [Trichinella pseudospiralis]